MSPEQAPKLARTRPSAPSLSGGLADPAARRWVILGGLGILSSLLLTVAVALLSSRGVASADVPQAAAEAPARNRLTMVREIGGVPKSPTPGTGLTASAPAVPGSSAIADNSATASQGAGQGIAANALRQLRRVGRAIVTTDGIRRLALGGAVPFADGNTVTAFLFSDDTAEVALGESDADATFLRMSDLGRSEAVVMASPAAVTPTSQSRTADASATPVPATATTVFATATPVPATATTVSATATPVPATATPVVVTATSVPATQTPIIVTATPEPTRRATRTPTPEVEVVVVTATPWTSIIPGVSAAGTIPWLAQPTNTPAATNTPFIPPTAAPTNTPIPTATFYTVPDARTAAAPAAPARQATAAPIPPAPAGTPPILAEAGTRTPATPATSNTPAARATSQHPQPTQNTGAAASADAPRDPSVLDKLAGRALGAINAARAQAGALPLTRNAALDVSSALHAQYDVATGQIEGNFQTRGTPQFVGETPSARAARAANGRSPAIERVAEVMALGETEPERVVQGWLDSVFHRVLLLDLSAQFAGYGQATGSSATTAVLDLGGKRDVANASGWFPASGATEVPTRCACDDYAEMTSKSGPFGYPITLLLGQQRPQGMPTLATLSEGTADGPGVAAELVDAYGNPTLLPQAPLKAGTVYVVKMAWTNGPSVSWSFTTGN